jgi:hypothetical protein
MVVGQVLPKACANGLDQPRLVEVLAPPAGYAQLGLGLVIRGLGLSVRISPD